MKKYLAMLLAVVMVFAMGASAFAADTGDTYSSYDLRQRPVGDDRRGHGPRHPAGVLADLQQRGRLEL